MDDRDSESQDIERRRGLTSGFSLALTGFSVPFFSCFCLNFSSLASFLASFCSCFADFCGPFSTVAVSSSFALTIFSCCFVSFFLQKVRKSVSCSIFKQTGLWNERDDCEGDRAWPRCLCAAPCCQRMWFPMLLYLRVLRMHESVHTHTYASSSCARNRKLRKWTLQHVSYVGN